MSGFNVRYWCIWTKFLTSPGRQIMTSVCDLYGSYSWRPQDVSRTSVITWPYLDIPWRPRDVGCLLGLHCPPPTVIWWSTLPYQIFHVPALSSAHWLLSLHCALSTTLCSLLQSCWRKPTSTSRDWICTWTFACGKTTVTGRFIEQLRQMLSWKKDQLVWYYSWYSRYYSNSIV